MSVRQMILSPPDYCTVNREERNYAAILFTALCKSGNTERFLQAFGFNKSIGKGFGIYFEYAYLRDLWYSVNDENVKIDIIRKNLTIKGIDKILSQPVLEINRNFGITKNPSKKHIQNPGKWEVIKFHERFKDDNDFLKICSFKWSFNIKPDIVIHLNENHAICIETKFTSGEGVYPKKEQEKYIFEKRGIDVIRQTKLQKHMMEKLLGFKTNFMFIKQKASKRDTLNTVSWDKVFKSLDLDGMPRFALDMIQQISS